MLSSSIKPPELTVVKKLNKMENKNMTKGPSLQDPFLNTLRKEKIPVSIYLVNGIKLQGLVESFQMSFTKILPNGCVVN